MRRIGSEARGLRAGPGAGPGAVPGMVELAAGTASGCCLVAVSSSDLTTSTCPYHASQMVGDDTSKTAKLAMILHKILSEADEPPLLELTARTMGRLVKSGAALTSDRDR